jgi:hypothetical protein
VMMPVGTCAFTGLQRITRTARTTTIASLRLMSIPEAYRAKFNKSG